MADAFDKLDRALNGGPAFKRMMRAYEMSERVRTQQVVDGPDTAGALNRFLGLEQVRGTVEDPAPSDDALDPERGGAVPLEGSTSAEAEVEDKVAEGEDLASARAALGTVYEYADSVDEVLNTLASGDPASDPRHAARDGGQDVVELMTAVKVLFDEWRRVTNYAVSQVAAQAGPEMIRAFEELLSEHPAEG